MNEPTTRSKPVPIPDERSTPFFEGASRHELLLLRCEACGTWMWPGAQFATTVRSRCVSCYSDQLRWAPSSGRGTLYSFALMHQVFDPAFAEEVPYNVSIVELEEGVRVTSNVVGCADEDLRIGMPLLVTFEDLGDGITIPKFRPAE